MSYQKMSEYKIALFESSVVQKNYFAASKKFQVLVVQL